MAKFRWTRELIAEQKQQAFPRRLPDAGGEQYETMAEYWARMARKRDARRLEARMHAARLSTMPRPKKPPTRRAEGE